MQTDNAGNLTSIPRRKLDGRKMSNSPRHQEKRRERAKQKAKEGPSGGRMKMIEPAIDVQSPSWWKRFTTWLKSAFEKSGQHAGSEY